MNSNKQIKYYVEFKINSITFIPTESTNDLETAKNIEKFFHSNNIVARIVKVVSEEYCI